MPAHRSITSLGTLPALAALVLLASAATPAGAVDWPAAEQRARKALRDSAGVIVDATVEFRASARPVQSSSGELHAPADQCAYYDRARRAIVVDVNACRHKLFASMDDTVECGDAAFVLMLHELIHAYQDEQIRLHERPLPGSRWLRFLCEGHAVEFSRRIAIENGVSPLTLAKHYQAPAAAPQSDLAKRRGNLLFDFNYVLGPRYVAGQCRRLDGFADLLNQNLNYPTVLALAQNTDRSPLVPAVSTARRASSPATQPAGTALKRVATGHIGDWMLAEPMELDYLDALVYVAPADFPDPQLAASFVSANLVGASGTDGAALEACVLRLRDSESARTLWLHACTQQHGWAGDINDTSHADGWSTNHDDLDFCRDWPAKGRVLLLIRRGAYVVVANGIDRHTTYGFVDQLLQKAFSAESLP